MNAKKGMSLVELIVVLAIIAALVFLGLPTYGGFYSFIQLWGDGRRIASDLREFHQRAISEIYDYEFTFLDDKNYKIDKYDGVTWIEESKRVKMQEEVAIQSATSPITFHPLGNAGPGEGATIVIRNIEGETSTISVRSTTGHVSIE